MLRQSSSRNQKSKGLKMKHAAQLFVLVTVCIWLLYQLKYSHNNEKTFGEVTSVQTTSEYRSLESLKLGRKDLVSSSVTMNSSTELQETQEEGDEKAEISKEQVDEETKISKEETDEDNGVGSNDEIDVQDHEQGNDEIDAQDHERAAEEETKESLDDVDREHKEESESVENHFHNNVELNSQEAWEEQYKEDDPANALIQHHNNMDGEDEERNIDLKEAEDRKTQSGIESSDRTNDISTRNGMDESELQEEKKLSHGHSLDTIDGEDSKWEAQMIPDSSTVELQMHEGHASNSTVESLSDPTSETLVNPSSDGNSNMDADGQTTNMPWQNTALGMDAKANENETSEVEKMVDDSSDLQHNVLVGEDRKVAESTEQEFLEELPMSKIGKNKISVK